MVAATISLLVALEPTAAHAAVVAEFSPAEASPGVKVQMNVVGLKAGDAVAFFLMPKRAEDAAAKELPQSRLVARRRIRPNEEGGGAILDFTVPSSSPGRYVIVMHCQNCASGGGTFSAVGDFVVIRPSSLPATGRGEHRLLRLGALLFFLGALVIVRSHQHGESVR